MMHNTEPQPPRWFLKFFRWFCHEDLQKYIEGDLFELYAERVENLGRRRADLYFIKDVLWLFRPSIIRPTKVFHPVNNVDMFSNYFKVGFRNILKYKVFSFINVFGLALAMAVCMLIILMLADQRRYDAFHEKKDRTYRILSDFADSRQPYATSPLPLAEALKNEYPVVEETTSLTPEVEGDVTYQQQISELHGYFADPAFFKVFSFVLDKGDARTALSAANTMVISQAIALKLFGQEDPIGKTVEFADRKRLVPGGVPWGSFTVTGVIDESNYKSHLKFDVLMSAASMPILHKADKLSDMTNNWEWFYRTYTFVLLRESHTTGELKAALADLVKHTYANIKSESTKGFRLMPQPLPDVQLGLMGNDTNNRLPRIGYYFLSVLAIVIMLSACLNYTNLSVARAMTRAREIGVRKVTGANRLALVYQFVSESVITAMLALVTAIVLLTAIKPAFQALWINQFLQFEFPTEPYVYLIFIGFALFVGIVAGLYPALRLSAFQPIRALKNPGNVQTGKLSMRKALSVTQFVISLFFISTSILIFNQFRHFMEFDYGFTSSNIVNIDLQGADYRKLSNELSSVADVIKISACNIIPSTGENNNMSLRKLNTTVSYQHADILITDENFVDNLALKIIAGRNFPGAASAASRFVIVNEDMTREFGYKHPADIIGESFEQEGGGEPLEVIGVVSNFHYRLLINKHDHGALVLQNRPAEFRYVNVKISSPDAMRTVAQLEARWKAIDPVHPFKYEFFDEQLASTHKGILDLVSVLGFIALLAIVIACLGLLGMATYIAERKRKEVGIRKILGAQNASIAYLLSKDFIRMLVLAVCIGAPISYSINNVWLTKFPNRVDFSFATIAWGVLLLLVLGMITIGSQTIKASRANPVDALKID